MPETSHLREQAAQHMADAETVLRNEELGEMEAQILQSRLMERAYNLMQQVAIIEGDERLLKMASEAASKWATNTRAATTKRRNDEVPRLIRAMEDRKAWARKLMGIEEEDEPEEAP
ncbi:MAG: hypothetical protein AAFP15_16005 [Bacteroidota bacterium]